MYDSIIIGAGTAGLSAAIYLLRANKKILILEEKSYGGQIINTEYVENYPSIQKISGFDFATNLYNQVVSLGGKIVLDEVISIKKNDEYNEVITKDNKYSSKTIIIATGNEARKLGILNEEKFYGKGISYCAVCDGNFYKNKDVLVVGGGNTALGDALYLSNIANHVYLVHRKDKFSADQIYIDRVFKKENISVIYNSVITGISGNDSLENVEILMEDNTKKNIPVNGLFVAIGRIPNCSKFSDIVNINDDGYIITDEECHTNVDGIFAIGDVRVKKLRQLITAASDGAIVSEEVINYLELN